MSLYKTENGAEFSRLVRESGKRPAEISRLMKISKPTVSNYLSGKIPPPDSRVDSLRRIVEELKGILDHKPDGNILNERAGESDVVVWKRRAVTAEKQLHELQTGLGELIQKSKSPPKQPHISSSETREILTRAEGGGVSPQKEAHPPGTK